MSGLGSGNELGDTVIDSAEVMRALADPARLAIVDRMTRHGPHTVARLACELDMTTGAAATHVDCLADVGLLVAEGDDSWVTVGKGIFLRPPDDDPEAQQAAR